MNSLDVTLADIRAARDRVAGFALRTPLVRLQSDHAGTEIYLKLENLQPTGSFKQRGAANAMLAAGSAALAAGVWTPSAGNMALGVAWTARRLGVRARVVVPEHAPRAKLTALERLGAEIVAVPFDAWWQTIQSSEYPADALLSADSNATAPGLLVHPVADPGVIAGNGTIGLEILEDLPDVDSVLVPYGGGGLSAGIGLALSALRPATRVLGCEIETAAPLATSLATGHPSAIEHQRSFVDGIGGKSVLSELWPLAQRVLAGSLVVSLADTCKAIRVLLERNHVLAEGAGAVSVAAACAGLAGPGKTVCIVSGGNLNLSALTAILAGEIPQPGAG